MTAKEALSFYNRSLERALKILCVFNIEMQSVSLGQLSRAVDLPKSTVLRLCSTLTQHDFLGYDSRTKQYFLGLKFLELGGVVSSSLSLKRVSSYYLDQLQAKVGKTVFLGILRNDEVLYIDKKEDFHNEIRFASHIGQRRPACSGMLGQVLMAYLSETEVNRVLEKHPLVPSTPKSVTNMKVFKGRLKKIREQGYFIDEEESIEGITGIASPILDSTGKVVAALGVGFISSSVGRNGLRTIRNEVIKTAREISDQLGYLENPDSLAALR